MLHAVLPPGRRLLLPALVAMSLSGCATKEFVQQEMALVNQRIVDLENTLGHADKRINAGIARIQATEERIGKSEQAAATLTRKVEETQSSLAGAQQNLAGLLVGLNTANQRIDDNTARIAGAQQRLGEVARQADALNLRLDAAHSDLAGVQSNLAGLLAGLNTTNLRLDEALGSLARVDGRMAALEGATTASAATAAMPATAAAAIPVPPVASAAVVAVPAQAVPPAVPQPDMQDRLARVSQLIDEVHRRINVNTSSLQSANFRIGALEEGLSAAGKRDAESEAAIKSAQERLDAAQAQLTDADKRITANTHALEVMGPHIDAAKADIQAAATRLEATEARLSQVSSELGADRSRNETEHAALSRAAQEALDRAMAAGKLAEGRLLAETVLSEAVGFSLEQSMLGEQARAALRTFADRLKADNQGVFVEIQGHTDNSGTDEANLRLSRLRAEAVRDFLHREAGLPLHRLAVAAYGESQPVADNGTREGRIQNRRVVLLVLK